MHTLHTPGSHKPCMPFSGARACSNKIMDPEVPHALRLQGILVGMAPCQAEVASDIATRCVPRLIWRLLWHVRDMPDAYLM